MAKKIDIQVQESEHELKKSMPRQKNHSNISKVKMLLLIKQGKVIYTKDLVANLKVSPKSIYNWLRLYEQGGLEELLAIRKRGGIPPLITEQTKQAIASKLADPTTTITSYVELLAWVHKNHQSDISYQVLYNHCQKDDCTLLFFPRKTKKRYLKITGTSVIYAGMIRCRVAKTTRFNDGTFDLELERLKLNPKNNVGKGIKVYPLKYSDAIDLDEWRYVNILAGSERQKGYWAIESIELVANTIWISGRKGRYSMNIRIDEK